MTVSTARLSSYGERPFGRFDRTATAARRLAPRTFRRRGWLTGFLTTHVGALPTPKQLVELAHKRSLGETFDKAEYDREIKDGVLNVVRQQKQVGVDLMNDGELPHNVGWAWDYGAWWSYVIPRLDGVEAVNSGLWASALSAQTKTPMAPNDFVVSDWGERRDMAKFQEAYMDPHSGCGIPEQWMTGHHPAVRGPIKYKGQEEIRRAITNLKAALEDAGIEEGGYINAIAPASVSRMANEYYKNEEELMYACADAMREEYQAIVDAGLTVQLDDPAFAENWDQSKNEPSVEGYRRYTEKCVEILQLRDPRASPGENPLPSLLGELAWTPYHRHSDAAPGRPDAENQCRRLFLRSGQRPSRARVEAVERHRAARGQGDHARHRQPLDQPDRAP